MDEFIYNESEWPFNVDPTSVNPKSKEEDVIIIEIENGSPIRDHKTEAIDPTTEEVIPNDVQIDVKGMMFILMWKSQRILNMLKVMLMNHTCHRIM